MDVTNNTRSIDTQNNSFSTRRVERKERRAIKEARIAADAKTRDAAGALFTMKSQQKR